MWLAAIVSLGGCTQSSIASTTPREPDDDNNDVLAKIPESIRVDLEHGRARDVLVELIDRHTGDAGTRDAGAFDAGRYDDESKTDAAVARSVLSRSVVDTSDESVSEKAERYRQLAERVIEQSTSDAVSVQHQYENFPMLHVAVKDLAGMLSLARNPEVLMVYENGRMEHQLAESLPLINQPAAASAGKLGAGTAVAVLDTGCDYTRAAFGSCSAPGGSCKIAYAQDFNGNDGKKDTGSFHGTNVSGIVLGVAPSAKILALDVFESTTASYAAITQAIDWVITNRTTYNIVAMNMSLGGQTVYASACSSDPFATPIANARNAGVLSAIASGNGASSAGISSPACVPAAVSVGAVWDSAAGSYSFGNCSDPSVTADKVTCFSNSAPILSMLAPGALITAAGISMTGTSQATPHVAGAMAVVRAAFPNETLSSTVTRLTSTGPSIRDARNGVTVHRLDLNAALGGTGTVDVNPPTGTLKINAGATSTKSANVTLSLSASDDLSAVSMCISNTTTCTTYVPVVASKTWALATGDGMKTVYVTYKDVSGNKTTVTESIRLDTVAPTGSQVTSKAGNAQVELSWTAATDAGSGVSGYKVQASAGATPPTCSTGTTLYKGTNTSFTHTGATNGTTYSYRVCPTDNASNVGEGPTAVQRPAPEFDAPTGTVKIDQDRTFTNKTAVTLSITASDASLVNGMCISNTATCTTFVPFAASKAWTLAGAAGVQTVRVWFKDVYGNANIVAAASDTIMVDSVAPTANTLTAVPADGKVTLSWTAATDANSGVAGYKVTMALGVTPTCTSGTVVYTGTDRMALASGLTNGAMYGFRVCPIDNATNLGTGSTTSSRPAPEFDGPTGTVSINQNVASTNNTAVTLSLSATDASPVSAMCISNSMTCTTFVAFAATKAWTLTTTSGVQTVRVWFRDSYGNVSAAPASDTILFDATMPTASTITAAAGNAEATLSWTASSDAASGLRGYKVTMALGATPTCTSGTVVYNGTERTTKVSGLLNGSTYGFRVCPIDNAGNALASGTTSARPAPEFNAPVGTVVINSGAQFTGSKTVTLTLDATDASGVSGVCMSSSTTCTTYVPYATSKAFTLAVTSGAATVRVWFKDIYGNVSASPASDTITVDTAVPSANALSAIASSGTVLLRWTAATDAGSGVAGYRVRAALKTAPTCATGTVIYEGAALTYTQTGLTNGTVYGYRVCPYDRVGNVATGGAIVATPK